MIQNKTDRLIFIIEAQCVLCKIQTEYFSVMQTSGPGHRIPVGKKIAATAQTGRGAHPTPYTKGTGSFSEFGGLGVALTTYTIQ
jgi:hypothetical protein